MAKISNTAGSSNIWLGSNQNSRQSIVYIPASIAVGSGSADKPGLLFLESIASTGLVAGLGGVYLWADDTDALRYSATYPTDQNSNGSVIGTATGASLALDNLASVAINTALLDDIAGQDDFGSATKYWKDLWFGGDIYRQSGTYDIKLDFSTPGGDRVYTIPDAGAAANVMLDTGAATAITYTKSTANITLGAAAKFDIAAAGNVDFGTGTYNFVGNVDVASGKTVDINGAVTIGTGGLTTSTTAVTLDQDLQASASPSFVSVTASTSFILGDSDRIIFGASGAADSYIEYDEAVGANGELIFFDRAVGAEYTLSQLLAGTPLNPIVTGDFTISDGQFDWTSTGTTDINTWDFGATTVDTFDIVVDNSTAAFLDIEADSFTAHGTAAEGLIDINVDGITSGNVIVIDTNQAGTFTGSYLKFYTDGSTDAFTVKGYGATTIAGVAIGTAALTMTAGDFIVTDGRLRVDIATDGAANGHIFNSDDNGTSNIPLLQLITTDSSNDQPLLQLDHAATGDVNLLEFVNDGTGYCASMDLSNNVAAEGLEVIFDTASTHNGIFLDGSTGTYVGASGYGMLHIHQTGTLAVADASAVFINFDGAPAASGLGYAILVDDNASAVATTYAVSINSAANVPLHLESGSTTKEALRIEATASGTASEVIIDGATNDWDGADNVGMLQIDGNTALADAGAAHLMIRNTGGAAPVNNATGHLARFEDLSNAGGGTTEYAVEIHSNNNEALNVSKGASIFVGAVTMSSTLGVTAATTFTAGQQSAAVSRTSGDGTGTAAIADGTTYVTTISGNAANWFKLPTPTPGNVVWLGPNATGHEVRSDTPASVAINGGSGADAESAVGANVTVRFVCTSSTTWVATTFAANGTEAALEAAA